MEHIINNFYVDEAGDLNLFDKYGKQIVGMNGVSTYFMVGVAQITNIEDIKNKFDNLRQEVINDPYFIGVPSLESTRKQFHACKDLPEIRKEVLKIIVNSEIKVFVAIKNKYELSKFAKELFEIKKSKLNENDIYDDLIKRVFRNILHKADINNVFFSFRGKSHRTSALKNAIKKAQQNFINKYKIESIKPVRIQSCYPFENVGLQVIDYCLWTLQRLYEKHEDRFYNLLSNKFKLIMDLDDKRNNEYGEWYNERNILKIKKLLKS